MQKSLIVGTRIRQRRRELHIAQSELARTIGISPSYLNLIEWNKRPVGAPLLGKVADALGVGTEALDGVLERRLSDTLEEIALLPALASTRAERERSGELIGRFPGWAQAIAALARAQQDAERRAQTLSDRLSNDPYLSASVHRMLTRIAAIRSAAEILSEYQDLPEERRRRFNGLIHEESAMLSEVGETLAGYLDKAEDETRVLTPIDEVEALYTERGNRFEEIERLAGSIGLRFPDDKPTSRRRFASDIVEAHFGNVIDGIVAGHAPAMSSAARRRAIEKLKAYAAGAVLMPQDAFAAQAADAGYDIEVLADMFSVDLQAVCHRLTALPRETGVPRFGYIRANAAGTIIEMLGLEGLSLPRYAAACPIWVLYRAQQSPETFIRQRVVFPSGARFVFIARARLVGNAGFGKPRNYQTDMIAMAESDVAQTVYAPDPSAIIEDVGLSCRLCPRTHCLHRVEDPLGS